jgi:hypothetical protein
MKQNRSRNSSAMSIWLDIARQNYEQLRESYPFPSRSVVDASRRRAD